MCRACEVGGRREQGGSLGSSASLERQRSGRADTSNDWNADKGKGGSRKKRFGSGGRGAASGSGSSTARSGGSTARSVASRADTEEWTRPLRVKPDCGREESSRRSRADNDSWKRSGGRRKKETTLET